MLLPRLPCDGSILPSAGEGNCNSSCRVSGKDLGSSSKLVSSFRNISVGRGANVRMNEPEPGRIVKMAMAGRSEAAGSWRRLRAGAAGPERGWEGGSLCVVWRDSATVTRWPELLSKAFTLKAQCAFLWNSDRMSGYQPPWRCGTVSCPEAMCFYHPVLVKEL